jgi:transcriptional regulator with XRE-family HTH domain
MSIGISAVAAYDPAGMKNGKDRFAHRLRGLRKQRGVSQFELASRLGITPGTVSAYETGRAWPSPSIIVKLAVVLDVSTDVLFGVRAAKTLEGIDGSTARLWGKLRAIQSLPERDQRAVSRLITSLLAKPKDRRRRLQEN